MPRFGTVMFYMMLILAVSVGAAAASVQRAEEVLSLTAEEKEYIAAAPPIKAAFITGVAPITYIGENKKPKGIAREVIETIGKRTGLKFVFIPVRDGKEYLALAAAGGADIIPAIAKQYAVKGFPVFALSKPYLTSKTVIYIRNGVDAGDLHDKRYAAIRGSDLPSGVNPETAVYFDTREAALDAVNDGGADYGYSNEFSLAYYTMKYSYNNILSLPHGKEGREFCIGYVKDDPLLIAIMNKALATISPDDMQGIVLSTAVKIDRRVSLPAIMYTYGPVILLAALSIILLLSFLAYAAVKNARAYGELNRRLFHLSRRDALTGIYNTDTQRQIVRDSAARLGAGDAAALMQIDIDNFKRVNDTYGHYHGDQVLMLLAEILNETFGEAGCAVGRMGGDEFSVYWPGAASAGEAERRCVLLRERIAAACAQRGIEPFTISVGILMISAPQSFDELYKAVDAALYQAKASGKNCAAVSACAAPK